MRNAHSRPASRKRATRSRRERCGRPESWRSPLRRVRGALASSLRLIDASQRVVDDSPEFALQRPFRTTRRLHQVVGWLANANARLRRAIATLDDATRNLAPADLSPELPAHLLDATARSIVVAARLVETSERLDRTMAWLLDSGKSGLFLPDPCLYRQPAPVARIPLWRPLVPKWPSSVGVPPVTIHVRRRRSTPKIADEPARRVSRGRAPPSSLLPL